MPTYLGLARLMRRALSGEDLTPLCQSMLDRAAADPEESHALLDAAILFQLLGNPEMALTLQSEALRGRRHYRLDSAQPPRLRLLALVAPGLIMANVPLECLLEDSDIELNLFYAATEEPDPAEIPEHDLLFVAIGESEANRPLLDAWIPRLAAWPKPVLNDPRRLERVARHSAWQRLHDLPGLVIPPTLRVERVALAMIAASKDSPNDPMFPLIVRPIDSHAGQDLCKLDTPAELSARLESLSADAFFVSHFFDYRSPDGLFRKYRIVLIQGRPFASHMAISEHWMIHYLNAGMADSPEKRSEEATFMTDFDQGFAVRHAEALAAIDRAVGLDYLGIDCAETQDGHLLIFEVDPAMVVHAMDPVDRFPYKQPAMRKVFDAFRAMLIDAAEHRRAGLAEETDHAGHSAE